MLALFIVLGAVLVTGLVAIPVIEEANAALCKTKDGITTCKDKKPKKHWPLNLAITSNFVRQTVVPITNKLPQ